MEITYTAAHARVLYHARRAVELAHAARCADAIAARGSAAEFRKRAASHTTLRNRARAMRKSALCGMADRARGCAL